MKNSEYILIRLKLVFSILILLLISPPSYGQKNLKYKDVYKVITEKSREEAYSILLVFQKQEPFSANTYIQLGMLAQYWSKDYDALTNLKEVEFFIYNTNLYYGLAMSKLEQKEVRKNEKFYQNIERFKNVENIDVEAIKMFIQEQLDANIEYKKNVKIVTNYFNLSILHYNNCIRIFKEINAANNKIKDIYLTSGKDFTDKLEELENSFDSTIYYLQNYQTAIKNYPIKNYNQKYKLLPIETYRLHGLTGSDFLQDEILIWDYRSWVKNVRQVLVSDITFMRSLINKAEEKLNQDIDLVNSSKEYKTDFKIQKVDDKLKYKIGKFDHKSLLLELFKYKESKLDYLVSARDPLNNPTDSVSGYNFPQKARFYESLIEKKKNCDSLIDNFANQIISYDFNKYKDFFQNNYGGETGLKNYCYNEKLQIAQTLKSSLDNFKEFMLISERQKITPDTLVFKSSRISLKISKPIKEKAENGKFYTTDIQKNITGDYYITGFTKQENNKISAFVAKTTRLESIKWLQLIIPEKQELNYGTALIKKEDGCEVLVNVIDTPLIYNRIIGFDNEGKQKDKTDLPIPAYPRYINYDEINQKYLIVYKGTKPNPLEGLANELIISQYDALTKQESWTNKINLNGTFLDIVKMNQDIFVFTSFTQYNNAGKMIESKSGNSYDASNSLLIIIDENGSIKNEVPILSEKPFQITKVIKSSSNTINLIGFKNQSPDAMQKDEFLFLLLNSKGNVYFGNWD